MLNPSFMSRSSWQSFHQHAAVDVEALAVDEAGRVREQEQDGIRDLFRLAEAPHRDTRPATIARCSGVSGACIGVSHGPGLTQLMRIAVPATARAKPFVIVTTAPLLDA